MRECLFALKRLYRSHLLIVVCIIALLLSLTNVWYATSKAVVPPADSTRLQIYPLVLYTVYPPEGTPPQGYRRYLELTGSEADAGLSSDTYVYALEAIQADQAEISEDHQRDLEWGFFFTHYLEAEDYAEEHYMKPSVLYLLRKGGLILYGLAPLLLFLLLAVWLYGEHHQKGSMAYHRVLPVAYVKVVLGIFFALLISLIFYLLSTFLFTYLIGLFRGIPLGRFDYPIRIHAQSEIYLSTGAFLLRMVLLFSMRIMTFIALGLALANVLRRLHGTMLVGSLVISFCYLLSHYSDALKSHWNPLFSNYELLFSGKRQLLFDLQTGSVSGYQNVAPVGITPALFMMVMLIPLCLWLSVRKPYLDTWGVRPFVTRETPLPLMFEGKKLQSILPLGSSLGLIVVIGLTVFSMIAFQDQSRINTLRQFDRQSELQEEIELLEEKMAADSVHPIQMSEYQRSHQTLMNRLEESLSYSKAYDEKDGASFYQGLSYEIDYHYGIDSTGYDGSARYAAGDYPSHFGYQVSKERNEYLISHDMRPMFDVTHLPTIYDKMINPSDELVASLKSQPADHSFLMLVYRLIHYYRFDWVLLVLLLVFFGSGFSTDHEYGLAWILTLPKPRAKLVKDKLIAALSLSGTALVGLLIILFVASLITHGLGPVDFPTLRYLEPISDAYEIRDYTSSFEFVPLWRMLLQTLILLGVQVLCLLSLSLFLSTFKTTPVAVAVSTMGLSAFGLLAARTWVHPLWALLPFSHLDTVGILTGRLYATTEIRMFQFFPSLLILMVWSIVFMVLVHVRISSRRDFL